MGITSCVFLAHRQEYISVSSRWHVSSSSYDTYLVLNSRSLLPIY